MANFLSNPWTITIFGGLIVGLILLKIQDRRKKRTGLHVIKAQYGRNGKTFDITNELNALINKNKLNVVLSNDLAGDPITGLRKIGSIKYRYNGKAREKDYIELETIKLP